MNKEITLYTKTICGHCMFVKNQMGIKGIEYKEVNLDQNEDKANELRDKGIMTAPIMEIEDQLLFGGQIMEFLEG